MSVTRARPGLSPAGHREGIYFLAGFLHVHSLRPSAPALSTASRVRGLRARVNERFPPLSVPFATLLALPSFEQMCACRDDSLIYRLLIPLTMDRSKGVNSLPVNTQA